MAFLFGDAICGKRDSESRPLKNCSNANSSSAAANARLKKAFSIFKLIDRLLGKKYYLESKMGGSLGVDKVGHVELNDLREDQFVLFLMLRLVPHIPMQALKSMKRKKMTV